ncbi:MAG: alpha/beta fold hydrolase [Clostridia bacterium]|nr:alpha/beta fold hydrolase [Clostridia bacterium]
MNKIPFSVQSDYFDVTLQGVIYEPDGSAQKFKGVVQIVHGMCEYRERYDDFMRYLVGNGYVAACYDQRGHGDSVETAEERGWFGDRDGVAFVEDAVKVTKLLRERYPQLPLTLFGHSMGSMIVRCYLREHDELIDRLIVSGSPSKNPLAGTAVLIAKTLSVFKGERHRSKMLSYLSTGKGDKKFPKEPKGAWLSHNRKNIDEFYSNPKGGFRFTCNGFENLFKLMKRTYQKKGYQVKNSSLPIHFVSGERDAVAVSVDKWTDSVEFMSKLGYKNVTGKLYYDLRHEILNEPSNKEVYADLLAFIKG